MNKLFSGTKYLYMTSARVPAYPNSTLIILYSIYDNSRMTTCWVLWPKIQILARWDRAKRIRICQAKGARSQRTEKRHGRATCIFLGANWWRLGFASARGMLGG